MERKIVCAECKEKLIVYEIGISVGIGNLTQEEAYCPKCGNLIYSGLSQNYLEVRLDYENK